MGAIEEHLEKHLGPFETLLDEINSPDLHIDLIPIPACKAQPFLTICTMGMSASPMYVPDRWQGAVFAEMLIALPATWPWQECQALGESAWWPMRLLKEAARLPVACETFLAAGHTLHGPTAEPSPECPFVASLVCDPRIGADGLATLAIGTRTIAFFQIIPLLPDELEFKLECGFVPLMHLLRERPVWELADPARTSVAPG